MPGCQPQILELPDEAPVPLEHVSGLVARGERRACGDVRAVVTVHLDLADRRAHGVAREVADLDAHRLAVLEDRTLCAVGRRHAERMQDDRDAGVEWRVRARGSAARGARELGDRLVAGIDLAQVRAHDSARVAVALDRTALQPDRAIAELMHRPEVVRHEHDGAPRVAELEHAVVAALAEALVTHGQHLVAEQDIGLDADGDREPEARVHAARIGLHGVVGEARELGELDDRIDSRLQLRARHPVERPREEDVLDRRVLRVEARSQLEQRRDAAVDGDAPVVRRQDAGQHLQQRRLAGSVRPDHAEGLAVRDRERQVVGRAQLLPLAPAPAQDRLLEGGLLAPVDAEVLAHALDGDGGLAHSSSASRPLRRLKTA